MLNVLDFIILLFFIWKGWRGLKNGVIIELGGFIILYLSFVISITNNLITSCAKQLMVILNISPDLKWLFSFIFIYILLFISLRLIHNAVESLSLGFINQFLGCAFGILKWWLIFNIIVFGLLFINKQSAISSEVNLFNKKIVSKSIIIKIMQNTANKYLK